MSVSLEIALRKLCLRSMGQLEHSCRSRVRSRSTSAAARRCTLSFAAILASFCPPLVVFGLRLRTVTASSSTARPPAATNSDSCRCSSTRDASRLRKHASSSLARRTTQEHTHPCDHSFGAATMLRMPTPAMPGIRPSGTGKAQAPTLVGGILASVLQDGKEASARMVADSEIHFSS